MTAAVSASNGVPHTKQTVSLSGHAASTKHTVTVTWPSGRVQTLTVTTDGTGAATVNLVPQGDDKGTVTITTTPATTTAATTTFKVN